MSHELSQPLAEGSNYQNLCRTSRSGASESSAEIRQLRQECDHLNVHGRNLEIETPACQSAVRSVEAHVVQIPQLRGMLEVGKKKSTPLQAEVFRFGSNNLQISHMWDKLKEELAQLQGSLLVNFGIILNPHSMREMDDISLKGRCVRTWKNISLHLLPQVVQDLD